MKTTEKQADVTVGVRFHNIDQLNILRRAIWSITGQTYTGIRVLVCCQGFAKSEQAKVRDMCAQILSVSGIKFDVLNVPNPKSQDLRSRLLNKIIAEHQSKRRYLAFLDHDDIWFSHAIETLVEALRKSNAGVAFGDIHCANVHFQNDNFFVKDIRDVFNISSRKKADLLNDNFLPIHSYLIDTKKVAIDDLQYDESLSRLEDYDLLLRLAAKHAFTPMAANTLIGLYNFYVSPDGDLNSSRNIFETVEETHSEAWQSAKAVILHKNGDLNFGSFLADVWVDT